MSQLRHFHVFISGFDDLNLTINTDMATVVKAMANPDSGLEIRDRMWLKITIPNAFIGESRHSDNLVTNSHWTGSSSSYVPLTVLHEHIFDGQACVLMREFT